MALPISWVDRIFDRMTVRYGDRFLNRWKGIDMEAVRNDWASVLAGFENWPEAFVFAFDNLDDEKPPTATMFRSIALKAPKPERIALPEPKPDPTRIAAELAKLAPLRITPAAKADSKAWAKVILDRYAQGHKISPTVVQMAKAVTSSQTELEAA